MAVLWSVQPTINFYYYDYGYFSTKSIRVPLGLRFSISFFFIYTDFFLNDTTMRRRKKEKRKIIRVRIARVRIRTFSSNGTTVVLLVLVPAASPLCFYLRYCVTISSPV